jgi:hypothetical protein
MNLFPRTFLIGWRGQQLSEKRSDPGGASRHEHDHKICEQGLSAVPACSTSLLTALEVELHCVVTKPCKWKMMLGKQLSMPAGRASAESCFLTFNEYEDTGSYPNGT